MIFEESRQFAPPCCWIGVSDWRDDAQVAHDAPFAFRRPVVVPDDTESLVLHIACSLRYCVYWDSALVHEGPARSLPGEVIADERRIFVERSGAAHALVVIVVPATGVSAYGVHDRIGLLARLVIPGSPDVVTDDTWTVAPLSNVRFHGRLCSLATHQQEHWADPRDCNLGASIDERPARVLGSLGTPPWRKVLQRDCAMLERTVIPAGIVYHGRDDAQPVPVENDLARAFNAKPLTAVEPVDDPARNGVLLNASRNVVTLDAGRTRMLRPRLEIAPRGAGRIEVFYDVGFDGRPRASLGFESPREGFADSIALTPRAPDAPTDRPIVWHPLVPRGARFVTLRYAGTGECLVRAAIEAIDYPYPERPTPAFNRPILGQIWERSVATLRSATTDVIVDTCWRESVLWTFDAAVAGAAHWLAFGDATHWRRALSLVARWAEQSGPWPTAVVPAGSSGVILPDQTLHCVAVLKEYAEATGDRAFAIAMMPCFETFLVACVDCMTDTDLFVPPNWCWHWIDWAPIDRRPYSMPINLLLLRALEAFIELAPEGAAYGTRFHEHATRLRRRLADFWDDSAGCYRDRLSPPRVLAEPTQVVPMPSADVSAHANALALAAQLGDAERQQRVAHYLATHLEHLPFGPGWTGLVLGPLIDAGHADAAIEHLQRLYRPWIEAGEPTWSEGFGQCSHNSAHGWGASAIAVLARLNSQWRLEADGDGRPVFAA